MIELLLLLCGTRVVRRRWWAILLFGMLWLVFGAYLFADALTSANRIPPIYFAVPLLLDGVWSLATAIPSSGAGRPLRLIKGATFIFIVLLIIFDPRHSGMIIGILSGGYLMADGGWRMASAHVVRFEGWRASFVYGAVKFLWGIWALVPWPTHWEGEVGADVGSLLMFTGVGMCGLAFRIRRLTPDMPILTLLHRGWPKVSTEHLAHEDIPEGADPVHDEVATVHVWTPTAQIISVNRGVSRYVAAVDKHGVVSTGHAALELPPDVYISHYPAVEIDRSGADFTRVLRGTRENDVEGLFQPNYQDEAAGWCPSTAQVRFRGLNTRAIREFWKVYRTDTTYNLTTRNCSSVVAQALDAGMEGLLERQDHPFAFPMIHLMLMPELWVAGFMRHRAVAMAWTPGIVLDYARALAYLLLHVNRWRRKRRKGKTRRCSVDPK